MNVFEVHVKSVFPRPLHLKGRVGYLGQLQLRPRDIRAPHREERVHGGRRGLRHLLEPRHNQGSATSRIYSASRKWFEISCISHSTQEWFQADLGGVVAVRAIRVEFRRHPRDLYTRISDLEVRVGNVPTQGTGILQDLPGKAIITAANRDQLAIDKL